MNIIDQLYLDYLNDGKDLKKSDCISPNVSFNMIIETKDNLTLGKLKLL